MQRKIEDPPATSATLGFPVWKDACGRAFKRKTSQRRSRPEEFSRGRSRSLPQYRTCGFGKMLLRFARYPAWPAACLTGRRAAQVACKTRFKLLQTNLSEGLPADSCCFDCRRRAGYFWILQSRSFLRGEPRRVVLLNFFVSIVRVWKIFRVRESLNMLCDEA